MLRKLIAVLTTIGIALTITVTASGPAEAAGKKSKVSISAPARITQGAYLTIRGKVKPAAVRRVVLQQQLPGAKWKNLVTLATAADGSWSNTGQVTKLVNRRYRAYVPKAGKLKAASSKPISVTVTAPVRSSATVTITGTGPTSITAGQSFVVNGTTSANLAGHWVQLQIADATGWSTIGSAVVAGNATFSVSGPATGAGTGKQLRVFAPQTATNYASTSGSAWFTVFGWYYLSELNQLQGDFWTDSVNISGQTYPKSIGASFWYTGTSSTQFDLGRKCIRLNATAGWSDTASATNLGAARVYKDSYQAWTATSFGLGSSNPVDIDLTGALRLKIEAQSLRDGRGSLAFGDARILCAF